MLKTNLKTETAKDRLTRMALSNSGAGASPSVPAPAVMPKTASSGNTAKERLAKLAAQNSASGGYSMERPTVNVPKVNTPAATAPKTDAPKTETAKQTTATETEFDPVTGFNLPTTKAALEDANVFGKKVASGLDTLRLSNTANPEDYVLDETTGFMMPSSDFGEAVIQKGAAATVGTVRNIGNEASYLFQQVGRRAEGMNSGDYVMEFDPVTGFELPVPKHPDTSPLKTTFNFGREYQEEADSRFKKYESDPINKAIGAVSTGVGGMVPAIVSSFIVPSSGIWVMATGAAGGATEEALKNGASNESALTYGIAVGAIEAATEKIADGLGGIMGKGWSDEWVSNVIKQVCQKESTAKAINAFAGALGEGFEEWVAEYAEAYANKLMVGQDERNFKDISGDALYSFAIGSLISVALQGADINGIRKKIINPKSAGEQAASQCIQSISQNTDNNTATLQNTQNTATSPTAAQEVTQGDTAVTTQDGVETPQSATQAVTGESAEKTVDSILSGDVTNSKAESIINDPALRQAFEEKSGEKLSGTKSEMRGQIKDYAAAQIADNAVAAIDGGGAAQNTQNPVQAPTIASNATQAKPATYTASGAESNTAQQAKPEAQISKESQSAVGNIKDEQLKSKVEREISNKAWEKAFNEMGYITLSDKEHAENQYQKDGNNLLGAVRAKSDFDILERKYQYEYSHDNSFINSVIDKYNAKENQRNHDKIVEDSFSKPDWQVPQSIMLERVDAPWKKDTIIREHKQSVINALNSGENVPSDLLQDYPDLSTQPNSQGFC